MDSSGSSTSFSSDLDLTTLTWMSVITWNVNRKDPPKNLSELLRLERGSDIIAIGLQEVSLYPIESTMNNVFTNNWTKSLDNILLVRDYHKVKTVIMIGIVLYVYVRSCHIAATSFIKSKKIRTGFKGLYGNKGAVFLRVKFYDKTISFLTGHFHANVENVVERIRDYKIIEKRTQKYLNKDDYTFWFGDFNSHLLVTDDPLIRHSLDRGDFRALLEKDELNTIRSSSQLFKEFQESPINFHPTYKFLAGSNERNFSKNPGWTDRVLYTTFQGKSDVTNKKIITIDYDIVPNLNISDHKPVEAVFVLKIDSIVDL